MCTKMHFSALLTLKRSFYRFMENLHQYSASGSNICVPAALATSHLRA